MEITFTLNGKKVTPQIDADTLLIDLVRDLGWGFTDLVAGLKHLSMPPLIFVMVTVAVCAGACGSASGGMGVAFKALKDTYLKLGASLPDIHRISTIAAGTLDTLPHQGAQITLLGICKLTHK